MTDVQFKDSNGRSVPSAELQNALNRVAEDWLLMGFNVYMMDQYPAHVSESAKYARYEKNKEVSERIRNGLELNNFTIRQRVDTYLTGNCAALLPK